MMPKQICKLSVLISCPADLEAERRIIESAVAELNPILEDTYCVVLSPIMWNRDLVPGIGEDPQSVINSQIAGRYDIYLGLLGARFGTETPRAGSGTEEEFDQAYDTYMTSPQTVRVLFYFRTTSENIHNIDLDQLARVKEFRKKLTNAGVFFFEFANQDILLKSVKDHLRHLIAEQWDRERWKVLSPRVANASALATIAPLMGEAAQAISDSVAEETEAADGLGSLEILDAIVAGEAAFSAAMKSLQNMTGLMERLNESVVRRTGALTTSRPQSAKEMKEIVDGTADDLNEYARDLKREIIVLNSNLGEGLNALESALRLYFVENAANTPELKQVSEQLQALVVGMQGGRASVGGLWEIIANLPKLTIKFRKAKHKTAELLAELSASITVFLDRAQAIRSELDSHLGVA